MQPSQISGYDTSTTAVIQFDQNGSGPFPNGFSPTSLTNDEIVLIDSIIATHVKTYNQGLEEHLREANGLDLTKHNYKRQYIPVINIQGEKEVWANFFCDTWGNDWKREIVFVKDGGNCFFNLKVNVATKEAYELSVNGYAWRDDALNRKFGKSRA